MRITGGLQGSALCLHAGGVSSGWVGALKLTYLDCCQKNEDSINLDLFGSFLLFNFQDCFEQSWIAFQDHWDGSFFSLFLQ